MKEMVGRAFLLALIIVACCPQMVAAAFNTIMGFGDQAFTMIVLLLSAGLSSHIAFGYGTKKAREMFLGLVLLLMVGVQLFHLINAAVYVPATRFYTWNSKLHRTDCIESSKGGKRPGKSTATEDVNPCWCGSGNICTSLATGLKIAGTCPIDGTAKCTTPTGKTVHKYMSSLRNCQGGQEARCTLAQPCYPCERAYLHKWGMGQRCRSCSSHNSGNCNFIPGEGPYCFTPTASNSTTKQVGPCKKCCTEPTVFIGADGICY